MYEHLLTANKKKNPKNIGIFNNDKRKGKKITDRYFEKYVIVYQVLINF